MSSKLPRVSCQQVIRALKRAGFEEQRQRGSHLHLYQASNQKRVTVAVHKGRTVPPGTLRAILRDAGLDVEEFCQLL